MCYAVRYMKLETVFTIQFVFIFHFFNRESVADNAAHMVRRSPHEGFGCKEFQHNSINLIRKDEAKKYSLV